MRDGGTGLRSQRRRPLSRIVTAILELQMSQHAPKHSFAGQGRVTEGYQWTERTRKPRGKDRFGGAFRPHREGEGWPMKAKKCLGGGGASGLVLSVCILSSDLILSPPLIRLAIKRCGLPAVQECQESRAGGKGAWMVRPELRQLTFAAFCPLAPTGPTFDPIVHRPTAQCVQTTDRTETEIKDWLRTSRTGTRPKVFIATRRHPNGTRMTSSGSHTLTGLPPQLLATKRVDAKENIFRVNGFQIASAKESRRLNGLWVL